MPIIDDVIVREPAGWLASGGGLSPKKLRGRRIERVERRSKYLLLRLAGSAPSPDAARSSGMTGSFVARPIVAGENVPLRCDHVDFRPDKTLPPSVALQRSAPVWFDARIHQGRSRSTAARSPGPGAALPMHADRCLSLQTDAPSPRPHQTRRADGQHAGGQGSVNITLTSPCSVPASIRTAGKPGVAALRAVAQEVKAVLAEPLGGGSTLRDLSMPTASRVTSSSTTSSTGQ